MKTILLWCYVINRILHLCLFDIVFMKLVDWNKYEARQSLANIFNFICCSFFVCKTVNHLLETGNILCLCSWLILKTLWEKEKLLMFTALSILYSQFLTRFAQIFRIQTTIRQSYAENSLMYTCYLQLLVITIK